MFHPNYSGVAESKSWSKFITEEFWKKINELQIEGRGMKEYYCMFC